MPYFIELIRRGADYAGSIHQGTPAIARSLPPLAIGEDVEVNVGQSIRLGQVVADFIDRHTPNLAFVYEERSQVELGQYPYQQLFGALHPRDLRGSQDARVDLRIVTDDEYIPRLPWNLLAHRGIFLSTMGWSVSLAQTSQVTDCVLPPSPRMLVVAPEPDGWQKTRAHGHLETLEQQLQQQTDDEATQ